MGFGGAERVAAHLANAWVERGDAVTLVATFSGRGECLHPLSGLVSLLFLSDLAGRSGRGVVDYLFRYRALRQLIRQLQPDVVVSFLSRVNVAAILASMGLARHVVVCERTYPPKVPIGLLWSVLRRITYPRAAWVVMLSREGLDWLKSHIPSARGAFIPNPVLYPLPLSARANPPDQYIHVDGRLLLAVGRLDQGKQFDRLMTSFAALSTRFPEWTLAILGDGPERVSLERLAARLGLGRRVAFPGQVGNPGDWYRRADLYAMSSRYENFPNSLAEAMAYGCAVVSYDCDTGPRDIIRHGKDGLLVAPVGDVAALSAALDRLMGDAAARERMAAQAVQVRDRYSLKNILPLWDQVFDASTTPRREN
jgi:glycosyltransferase involved in cell wall biosynthesis